MSAGRAGAASAWSVAPGGLKVIVRLTPKSARDAVEGIECTAAGSAIKVRVRAVPDKGAANAALMRLIARWLGLPRRAVSLSSGGKSRYKALDIVGEPVGLGRAIDAKIRQMTNG